MFVVGAVAVDPGIAFGQAQKDSLRRDVLTTWTTDQGLPQNFIRAITQTSDGFLWIGTLNGLVRFDGLHFRAFGGEVPALRGNVGGLEPDAGDGLWIAVGSGLFHYAEGSLKRVPIEPAGGSAGVSVSGSAGGARSDGKTAYRVEVVGRARSGQMWVYGDGRLYLTGGVDGHESLRARAFPAAAHGLRDLAETTDGTLWIADGDAVFARRDAEAGVSGGETVVRYPLAGVRMLYADDFGHLLAGDGHRLFRFDGKGFALVPEPGLGNFVSVFVDHERHLWMASGGLHGISRATLPFLAAKAGKAGENEKRVESLTAAEGLASNDARLVFEDRSHDIWIGTISGLQRLHRGLFTSFTPGDEVAGGERRAALSQVDSVFEQKDGSLWIGTLEGGVTRFKDGKWRGYGSANGLKPGQVRGFAENGALPAVAISDYGIFADNQGKFAKLAGIPGGYIITPVTAADGSLWFGVQRKGLFRLQGGNLQGEKLVRYGAAEGLPEGEAIGVISLDPTGQVWVAAGPKLLRWNGSRFETVISKLDLVLSVAWPQKSDGGVNLPLAIGTRSGLFFPSEKPGAEGRMLGEKDGLPGEMVLDVNEDAGGNLWIATTRAIARLAREQWMGFAAGKLDHVQPEIYTRADGLGSNTVLPLPQVSALRTRDGRMVFATALGFSVLNPELDPELDPSHNPEPAARVVIDSVTVDDREQALHGGSLLTVPPGQHRITFRYTTPPVPAPEQVRFRYRLSGWDSRWIEAADAREVSYTALPPGSYTFEVSAVTRSNRSTAAAATLKLELKPYFWQTRWFLTLAVLALAALLIEITRRRTRAGAERLSLQFQERAAERERIAYQIHDTVIQDMIGAALQMETVSFQIEREPAKASSNLNVLAQRLRETIARSRNMVWSLHSTAVVQYSLMEVLEHAEAEFRLSERPRFELTSQGEPRDVHPLVRDEVYRICREALANAFRHSNAEMVRVELRFLAEVLEVEIRDNGEGIDEETRLHGKPGHFGLPGMQAHAQRIGAQIEIFSTPGAGTRILLRVKTRRPRWRWWSEGRRVTAKTAERREEAV